MKEKKKKAARVGKRPSQNPRNPRSRAKGRAKTAAERVVRDHEVIEDDAGRWHRVERNVDTVELLYRRRQIDERQRQAAGTYLDAVDACRGGVPCALDVTRVGGGGGIPSPTEQQLWGAQVLADAARVLGLVDGRLVYAVVAEGRTIEEVAKQAFGPGPNGKARETDAKHIGRRLREALTALADAWWPIRPARILGMGTPPVMGAASPGEIEPGRVVHATSRRVYEIGGKRG